MQKGITLEEVNQCQEHIGKFSEIVIGRKWDGQLDTLIELEDYFLEFKETKLAQGKEPRYFVWKQCLGTMLGNMFVKDLGGEWVMGLEKSKMGEEFQEACILVRSFEIHVFNRAHRFVHGYEDCRLSDLYEFTKSSEIIRQYGAE